MADQFKRGRLGNKDKEYIRTNAEKYTAEEIAAVLQKEVSTIRKFILENCHVAPMGEDVDEDELEFLQIRSEFKKTPEWEYLREEFDPEEVRYFEHRYVKLVQQFKEDITSTEETQVFNLIKYEILMHRNRKRTMSGITDMERMQKAIGKVYKQCNNDVTLLTENQRAFIENMERHLLSYREAQHSSTKEYTELQTKQSSIMKELKATRDQRVSRIESDKQTFVELIKSLQDEEARERAGRQIELMKLATDKEKQRLGAVYTFMDGIPDQPILNAETV